MLHSYPHQRCSGPGWEVHGEGGGASLGQAAEADETESSAQRREVGVRVDHLTGRHSQARQGTGSA